jgi:hypothetical protein
MPEPLRFGEVVQYHGSITEHHGPAVLDDDCECDDCWADDCGYRYVLIIGDRPDGQVDILQHVRGSSFSRADILPEDIPANLRPYIRVASSTA